MSIQLIVNADDYGHTQGVSNGIRDSHLHGIVTSTTAMMNMPGVEDDLHQAMQECPHLGLGVHLVLTTGVPLLTETQVESLIGSNKCFLNQSKLISQISSLNIDQVRAEWHAQIEKFLAVTGDAPDHFDSHHHVSYLSPGLFRVMLELAQEYDCAIRFPIGASAEEIVSNFPLEYARDCLKSNNKLIREFQVPHPDHFLTSFYGENATRVGLLNLLTDLPQGITEIMCHPGYADQKLKSNSVYHLQREDELAILTDQDILDLVKKKNIELVNSEIL